MRAEPSVISAALQRGASLVTDSVEADRCGILCLLLKSCLLSGFHVTLMSSEFTALHYKGIFKKLGTTGDKISTSLQCIELLQLVDIWDPSTSAQRLQQALAQAPHKDATKQVIVIDSLSCISSILEDSASDMMDIIRTALGLASDAVSVVMVAHRDVQGHATWLAYLEQEVDSVIALEALQVGKAAAVNMQLDVARPNRWGAAFCPSTSPHSGTEIHEALFAAVSERGILLHHNVEA